MKYLSIEKLVFGHNLVSNTCPKGIQLSEFNKRDIEVPKTTERFGLFETATPNFATYYPDVKAEDLQPKDSDFVYPVFRALSEVLVRRQAPIDFSLNDVLRASMKKLAGQTVFPNHEQLIGNELGVVLDVEWQDSYKLGNVTVPAGINSRLKIDGKAHPNIARGVMMDPPSIHSTSVTVEFEWEKSHNLTDDEFFSKLGTYDSKGKLIKRNVTLVKNYHEISLVPHGADAFAQKIGKDGKIVNPNYAGSVYKFNTEDEACKGTKLHFFSYKETESFQETLSTIPNESNNNTEEQLTEKTMNRTHILSLLLLSGFLQADIDKLSDTEAQTQLENFLKDALKDKGTISTLQASITEKDTKITSLTEQLSVKDTEILGLKEKASMGEIGEKALKQLRDEATRFYTLSCGDKAPDAELLKVISNSNFETANVLLKQYAKLAEDSVKLSCKDCGSHNVSRMSAAAAEDGAGLGDGEPTLKSNEDVMASFAKKNTNLFGDTNI